MPNSLAQKLSGVRDLKRILEITVNELGDSYSLESCQVMLSSPLDPNFTSICEYRDKAGPDFHESISSVVTPLTIPLVLQGRTFGSVSFSRQPELNNDELTELRVTAGEVQEVIRLAQVNDIVQRDSGREALLLEIGNVMNYSPAIGDALFVVVNILGKALNVSRCLFICTDDHQAGWKCYEFWLQDKVKSCRELFWPSSDSAIVAQTLLAKQPLIVYEGQENSYVSPVQEELQFIGVKSFLGIPLKSSQSTHGCVIVQQCDYRRAWTRTEIDMLQNCADKLAEALLKLPAEKMAREPIMQLHQRVVALSENESTAERSILDVRRALKGAVGNQAIPTARKSNDPPPPPPAPVLKSATKPVVPPPVTLPSVSTVKNELQAKVEAEAAAAKASDAMDLGAAPAKSESGKTIGGVLGGLSKTKTPAEALNPVETKTPEVKEPEAKEPEAKEADPYADLDFGDFGELDDTATGTATTDVEPIRIEPKVESPAAAEAAVADIIKKPSDTGSFDASPAQATTSGEWAVASAEVDTVPTTEAKAEPKETSAKDSFSDLAAKAKAALAKMSSTKLPAATPPTVAEAKAEEPAKVEEKVESPTKPEVTAKTEVAAAKVEEVKTEEPAAEAGGSKWGNLDAIPSPSKSSPTTAPTGGWGNLDDIPAPSRPSGGGGGGLGGGLRGSMMGKAKATSAASPLMSSLRKKEAGGGATAPQTSEPLDEGAAKQKLDALLSSSSNETSDYVFATPGLDMRVAGRIDGWIAQIEKKDRYKNGHARQVAQYSVALASEMGLSEDDQNKVRLAALLHDLGKLPIPQNILQKSEEELGDEDFVAKMGHTAAGAQVLESFPDLASLAPIVVSHHEEFDGEGFPQGLKGEEIPILARIICVANRYHELVATKTYGPGMAEAEAQKIIKDGSGAQFDPKVVDAFNKLVEEKKLPSP
ncbi:MAG: HD domain-containing protein [Candidatus Melainabacteria bacterium]|nr:HD domain-containing protein [Candidatus Melainabacteria bacterium]